jgi:aryl-phospho-beta-D-glucosidase BglC (GH1 family)
MFKTVLLTLLAAMACGAAGTALAADVLSVQGNELLASGTPVILRGVAVGDPILARQGRPLSDYERIARDWHANVVRISLHPAVWKHMPHAQVLDVLEREINAALGNGMDVILDWHTIGWPDGYYENIEKDWTDDPADLYDSNFDLAKSFWDEVSARFGKDGRIIFELWNEPVASIKEEDGEVPPQWEKMKPFYAELLRIVRTHSDNVVLATGNEWAYDLRGIREDPLPGGNVAYCWHIYASTDDNDETEWAKQLDDLQTVAPVMVTEWGFQEHTKEDFRGTVKTFGAKFVRDFLEGRRLHSTAWCWHPDWTPVMLKLDWKTPTPMGRFVMDYLAAPEKMGPAKAGS